jgi:peptide deformylase
MFNLFKKKEESKSEVKKNIKPIVTNIAELRKPCETVELNEDIKEIIQSLKDTLEAKKGLGLTANQIGINKCISYIKIPKRINKNKEIQYNELILINAKIIEKDRPIRINNESCLSFPGINVTTKRYVFITVEYLNEKMELQTAMFQDLEAICIAHEIDHQNGITIFDRKWRAK